MMGKPVIPDKQPLTSAKVLYVRATLRLEGGGSEAKCSSMGVARALIPKLLLQPPPSVGGRRGASVSQREAGVATE